jgi:hypothetical protein
MTPREAYAVLVYYAHWRRDDHEPCDPDAIPQPDPVQVGQAIDLAIETIRPIAWPDSKE